MTNTKTYKHDLSWEDKHGTAQGCCVNGTLYISGQFSHDMQGILLERAIPSSVCQVWRSLTS